MTCKPGGEYQDYNTVAISLSKLTATDLNIEHPYISFPGARYSNGFQRLDSSTVYQGSRLCNGHRATSPFLKTQKITTGEISMVTSPRNQQVGSCTAHCNERLEAESWHNKFILAGYPFGSSLSGRNVINAAHKTSLWPVPWPIEIYQNCYTTIRNRTNIYQLFVVVP